MAKVENYEQIRAKNALEASLDKKGFGGVEGGKSVAKKVPTQIMQDGFLGALAFAIETEHGYETVFKAILKHLDSVKMTFDCRTSSLKEFLQDLCDKGADQLRAVTAESLAYLTYLRRFAAPKKQKKTGTNVPADKGEVQ